MPAILNLVSLFGLPSGVAPHVHPANRDKRAAKPESTGELVSAVRTHGLRLVQLTDRDSSVMTVSQVEELNRLDPVVNTFRTVGQLHKVAVSAEVAVIPESRFAGALASKSTEMSSDLLLLPWGESGSLGDAQLLSSDSASDKISSSYTNFVKSVFQTSERSIAVLYARSGETAPATSHALDRPQLMRTYSSATPVATSLSSPSRTSCTTSSRPTSAAATICWRSCSCFNSVRSPTSQPPSCTLLLRLMARPLGVDAYFAAVSSDVPAKLASRVKFETALSRYHHRSCPRPRDRGDPA